MDKICKELKSFLEKYISEQTNLTYLVGFSGGYDSMCLLHSLKQVVPDNRIVAIHLNHNWRGKESDKEEQNCKNFCKKINVEFYSEKLNGKIPQTETAARKARYEFFEKCSKKFNSKIILTAHNKNDNVETLIFRICHGTGISGLQGIAPKRGIYYRPLLNIERKEIEAYCKKNNLTPNNDSSNNDNIHKRNLIRSEILPKMADINPNVLDSINSLSIIANEETLIVKEYISKIIEKISKNKKYSTEKFLQLAEFIQKRLLYEIITPLIPENYDRERILILWNFIKENINSKSGKKISITNNYWLFVNNKFFEIISENKKDNSILHISKTGEYEYDGNIINISVCDRLPDKGSGISDGTVYVDFSSIGDFNFDIRTRKDGDIIQPYGINGHQKLKKYLNSRKIPNHEKDNLILLAKSNEILWVSGIGISEKIKSNNNPTHRITIKKIPQNIEA